MPSKTKPRAWAEPLVLRLMQSHRSTDPELIIARHADRLRREARQDALPVDVDLIASVVGVLSRRAAHDFAGRIYADLDGRLVVDVNANDSEERQRFTVAHELCHLAFPGFKRETRYRLEDKQPGQNGRNTEEEYLCDLGAAALLMPRALVRGSYDVSAGLDDVARLSGDAHVSLQAAGNRLVSLSDREAVFLVFEFSHKPADRPALRRGEQVPKRLRLRYATLTGLDAYLPHFKSASEDSVFGRAWHGIHRERGRELLPGAEHLGAFNVDARAYGADRRVVLAVATRS
jgi:hypothetical protein